MKSQNRSLKISIFLLLIVLISFPLFYGLGDMVLRMWDESRLAVNAYEMHRNGNYLVTYFDGQPETWNTKPPLMIWLQVASLKVFGVNEFAIRFPAALAGLATCLLLFWFAYKKLQNYWLGIMATFILATSRGFIDQHVTRTGDYEALLLFFTSLAGICIFLFSQTKNQKWIFVFFLALTGMVLTKSITGLMFIPAFAFYIIWKRQVGLCLGRLHFYLGLVFFIGCVGSYYWLRELQQPGYLQAVIDNEWLGRFLETKEKNNSRTTIYLEFFTGRNFTMWFIYLSLAWFFVRKDKPCYKDFVFLFSLCFVFFLLLITIAKTKLPWYDAPIFPFAALVAAYGFMKSWQWLSKKRTNSSMAARLFMSAAALVAYVLVTYYAFTLDRRNVEPETYNISQYLKQDFLKQDTLKKVSIASEGYIPILYFDKYKGQERSFEIDLKTKEQLGSNELVLIQQEKVERFVRSHYATQLVDSAAGVKLFKIL